MGGCEGCALSNHLDLDKASIQCISRVPARSLVHNLPMHEESLANLSQFWRDRLKHIGLRLRLLGEVHHPDLLLYKEPAK